MPQKLGVCDVLRRSMLPYVSIFAYRSLQSSIVLTCQLFEQSSFLLGNLCKQHILYHV